MTTSDEASGYENSGVGNGGNPYMLPEIYENKVNSNIHSSYLNWNIAKNSGRIPKLSYSE